MQSSELCNIPKMQPVEIYNLLRLHEKTSKQNALRKEKKNENAFVYRDKDTAMIEIVDSGMDPNLGKRLLVSEHLLLTAMISQDVDRALRMLSVAIGHNAVKCVFVQTNSQGSPTDTCTVVHLEVDMAEAMCLTCCTRAGLSTAQRRCRRRACSRCASARRLLIAAKATVCRFIPSPLQTRMACPACSGTRHLSSCKSRQQTGERCAVMSCSKYSST